MTMTTGMTATGTMMTTIGTIDLGRLMLSLL
jgi:hypothetical protein